MGLVDYIFGNAINKRVNETIALQQAQSFATALTQLNIQINNSLPAINPDAANYYKIYKTIGAVYEVTDAISKKVLSCPLVFYKIKDNNKLLRSKVLEKSDPMQAYILKMQAIEEVDNYELHNLLTIGRANPYQTGSQFMWTTVLSFLLQGNTYIHPIKSGKKAKELYCFPNMVIDVDHDDMLDPIRGYTLQNAELTKFLKEDIFHIKTGTPAPVDRCMDYLYGVAPLRAYLESLRGIEEGKRQATKQAKNGGVFGFLSPKDKEDQLTADQKRQLHQKMVEARSSDDELSRVFPSSIALQWQSIGLPIGDLKLLELVSANEEDIYRAYHWPLQFHNQKASTSNNQATAVKQGVYDAVAPICEIIGQALTLSIGEGFGGVVIELDYTQLPEMAVNMKEVAAYISTVPKGVLTFNEMRNILKWGEKPEAYLNEHYVEGGLTTLRRVYEGVDIPSTT